MAHLVPPPRSHTAARPTRSRDPFFDAVRALAIVRVVAWHTFEWAPLSYVAAMPVMFFVGGVMARGSFDRRPAAVAIRSRLRRLLPPLWAYGGFTWVVLLLTGATTPHAAADAPWRMLWWIVPLWDPTGPDSSVAWWAPLWYLRAYLWLLLLTPLVQRAVRAHGASPVVLASATLGAAVAFAVEYGASTPAPFEDVAVYGTFWVAGMCVPELRTRRAVTTGRRALPLLTGALALGGLVWMAVRDVPLGIVNASPVAEMVFGAAWIAGLACVAPAIRRVASRRPVHGAVTWLNRRAISVYLWHSAAIVVAHEVLGAAGVQGPAKVVALVALVGASTAGLVSLAGPVEDRTAPRRDAGRAPRHRASTALAATAAVAVIVALPVLDLSDAQGAYVPASGRGLDRLIDGRAGTSGPATRTPVVRQDGPVTSDELAKLVHDWRRDWDMSGVLVGVARSDGTSWSGASGTDTSTELPLRAEQTIPAHSITKSFTGALVAQLAAGGIVDLDGPLSAWMPEFPHASRITIRQLAQHTSGLVDTGASPARAIEMAGAAPLQFEPGADTRYADSGYFLLGAVVERATGMRYEDLVRERLFAPLGLDLDTLTFGSRGSAGGIHTTVRDLARWAPSFWGGALGELTAAEARTVDPSNNFGIGTFAYCPCDGVGTTYVPELYGHLSAQGRLAWDPVDDLAVMIHTNEENDGGRTIDAWTDLDRRVRSLVGGRPLATAGVSPTPPAS